MTPDDWSTEHDLALLYISLAYGTDRVLADEELEAIVSALSERRPELATPEVQEIVMEALAVYLEADGLQEVVDAIARLKEILGPDDRRRVVESCVQIAESDGLFLGSERSLIAVLANAWGIRKLDLAPDDADADWTLMHDLGLMYLVVAHGGDEDLSDVEIQAMIERLGGWQPDLDEPGVRKVLREALTFYSAQPERAALRKSVEAIRSALPIPQRLAVLDDLMYIARSDGEVTAQERSLIESLSRAWDLGVGLNGAAERA